MTRDCELNSEQEEEWPSSREKKCKGPKARANFACLMNRNKAHIAGILVIEG